MLPVKRVGKQWVEPKLMVRSPHYKDPADYELGSKEIKFPYTTAEYNAVLAARRHMLLQAQQHYSQKGSTATFEDWELA